MNSDYKFNPGIDKDFMADDSFIEKNTDYDKGLKKIIKRADFPLLMIGGFLMVLLVIILFKLPEEKHIEKTEPLSLNKELKEIKKILDEIRYDINKIKTEPSADFNSKNEEFIKILNTIDKNFSQKFLKLEQRINKTGALNFNPSIKKIKKTEAEKNQLKNRKKVKKFFHKVKKDDTLYRISIKYGVSIKNIKKWNHLKTNSIHPGEKLVIKK